jgi:hypothetical protein
MRDVPLRGDPERAEYERDREHCRDSAWLNREPGERAGDSAFYRQCMAVRGWRVELGERLEEDPWEGDREAPWEEDRWP